MARYNIYRVVKINANSEGIKKEIVDTYPKKSQAIVSLFSDNGIKTAESFLAMMMCHTLNVPENLIEITKIKDKNMLTLVYDDGEKYAEHIYIIEEEK